MRASDEFKRRDGDGKNKEDSIKTISFTMV